MIFCWVTVHVTDMEKSLYFYQNILELKLERRARPHPGIELAFLGQGSTQIELVYNKEKPTPPFSQNISLGFSLPSLDDAIQKLKHKGIELHSGPFHPNPHIRFAYIQDPDGLKIQLVQMADES